MDADAVDLLRGERTEGDEVLAQDRPGAVVDPSNVNDCSSETPPPSDAIVDAAGGSQRLIVLYSWPAPSPSPRTSDRRRASHTMRRTRSPP